MVRAAEGPRSRRVRCLLACAAVALGLLLAPAVGAAELYLVDAHSQIDDDVDRATIVPLMDRAGIRHVILAARGKVKPGQMVALAAKHPDRITAAVRTKGSPYTHNQGKYYKLLNKQLAMPGFGAMAEVIMWHAKKGDKAPEVVVAPDDKRVETALAGAIAKGWPFVIHIEFAASRSAETFRRKMEAMLDAHPDHPFALIHMGQLKPETAARLLARHANLHFLTSHANPIVTGRSGQPWTDMFAGGRSLAPAWKALMAQYPDRFVLAFDNVWQEHWTDTYVEQAALWRKALMELAPAVARKVAHANAERLWKLPVAD